MSESATRLKYAPSGRVNWCIFLPLYTLTLLAGALLAGALYALFVKGWYYLFVIPMVAALLLSGLLRICIRAGKCRSRTIAWITGGIAGAVMYLGSYYIGMVALVGLQNAGRFDLFPNYVSFRAHTDVQQNEHSIRREQDPNPVMNWIVMCLELGMVLYLTGICSAPSAQQDHSASTAIGGRSRTRLFFLPATAG